jgi:FkbM family methyltransferase
MTDETKLQKPGVIEGQVNHDGRSRPFYLFDAPLDRTSLAEIFGGKSYPLPSIAREVSTIIDVGANVGAATVYFALYFQQARILAFEPSPDSYALLVLNTEGLPNVSTFNFGLSGENRRALLYLAPNSVTSSVQISPENTAESVPVELRVASEVLTEQNVAEIGILKLDTEGCEVPILRSLSGRIPQISQVFVEYHDEEDRLEIDRLLSPTHILWQGTVAIPHRGELCYVAKSQLPPDFRGKQIRKTP